MYLYNIYNITYIYIYVYIYIYIYKFLACIFMCYLPKLKKSIASFLRNFNIRPNFLISI